MCRGVSQLVKLISSSNRVDDPRAAPVTYPKLVRLDYLVFQQKTSHPDKLLMDYTYNLESSLSLFSSQNLAKTPENKKNDQEV